MHSSIAVLTFTIIVTLLAGCAFTPRTVPPDELSRYKRIGVISVAAQRVERQCIGFTIFGVESEYIDSSVWDIDSMYEQQMFESLMTLGGLEPVIKPYSRADFLHVNDLNGPWDAPAFRGPNWKAVENPIKSYCSSNRVDAILMTYVNDRDDFIGGTKLTLRGAGLYSRAFGSVTKNSFFHLVSSVAVVDCQTNNPVAIRELASSHKERFTSPPRKPISSEISRKQLKQLSDEQLQVVKSTLADLPANSWEPTIHALFRR